MIKAKGEFIRTTLATAALCRVCTAMIRIAQGGSGATK